MFASTLFALAIAHVAAAQTSTASLFPVGFLGDGLQGEAVGTAADGTTYVLSGTFATLSIPFTMTLVQDATHISENAVVATAGNSFFVDVQCGLSGGQALCTESISEGPSVTTITQSGTVSLIGVPIGSGGAKATASITSASVATSSASVLPPVISVSSTSGSSMTTSPAATATTTLTSASLANASASATSGASQNALVGFGIVLPACLVFLNSL